MTHTKSSLLTLSALGLTALIAGASAQPAAAQSAAAPPAAAPSASAVQTAPAVQPASAAPASRMEQQHLTKLRQSLRITPAEEGAWNQFAQVSMQNASQLDNAFRERAGKLGSMNAVESMQSFAKLDMQRAQDMQQLVPAFQQLYAALSPEQQRMADEMFRDSAQRHAARHASRVAAHR